MSLKDLKSGTFATCDLREAIAAELELLDSDDIYPAEKRAWLAKAVREYIRLSENTLEGHRKSIRVLSEQIFERAKKKP